jgi:O-acetyl-ADP-ribose deacetylase (regulator of RNase III)
MVEIIKGNIFTTQCQTIVNTINCVGVMGAGIAYECRLRYPPMYERYVELCKKKKLKIGQLWLYKPENLNDKWVLNFPTKYHWKYESKPDYLEKGLQKFVDTYNEKGITSIAFPLLGASNGGIPEDISLNIMEKYLAKCNIKIEIYQYTPLAHDDLFLKFKELWNKISEEDLKEKTGIKLDLVKKIKNAMEVDNIRSLSRLLTVKGIGNETLEKSFKFINNYNEGTENQLKLSTNPIEYVLKELKTKSYISITEIKEKFKMKTNKAVKECFVSTEFEFFKQGNKEMIKLKYKGVQRELFEN